MSVILLLHNSFINLDIYINMNRKETIKEIDLLALLKDVLAQKKKLSIVLCVSAIIGVIVAVSLRVE